MNKESNLVGVKRKEQSDTVKCELQVVVYVHLVITEGTRGVTSRNYRPETNVRLPLGFDNTSTKKIYIDERGTNFQ